ncbi:MAG: hypothetical protein COB15_00420 [Flavobacteriales bacterium]|nr:MAG: hypothetical protein COB15_00420 [Flavobacteriales bacterium]
MSTNKRLKILIVTDFLPYPMTSGGKICLFNFIDYLRKYHDFTLFFPSNSHEIESEKEGMNQMWGNVELINVDLRNSDNNSSRFFTRLIGFIKRKIDVISNNLNQRGENTMNLNFSIPFAPKEKKYIIELKSLFEVKDFDIIQVQLTQNLNLINILPKKPVKIFEQFESQYDVFKGFIKNSNLSVDYSNYITGNSELLENLYINKFDAVFTLNEKDSDYFKLNLTHPKIYTSPFGVLDKDIIEQPKLEFNPKKIIFSGNEFHPPNYDALSWYLAEIHAPISRRHSIKLHVTGMWSKITQNRLKKIVPDIVFEGYVDDYSKFLQDSIVVVPIRLGGGGLRTKILYAMANGAPVVTTSVGAFGIEGEHNKHFCVADTNTDFISAIDDFIMSPTKKKEIISNAHALILDKYNQTQTSERRQRQYLELYQHKNDNEK